MNDWVERHVLAILVIIICGGFAAGLGAYVTNGNQREADRTEAARAYVAVLRQACEERNERDAPILAGVKVIALDLEADPDTVAPISDALAPRDCVATYPMPEPGQIVPVLSASTTTTQPD